MNLTPQFNQKQLLSQLPETAHSTTEHGLITDVTELKKRYPKCFDVIRNFEGEYSFVKDPNVPPVQHGQRKIIIKLQEKKKPNSMRWWNKAPVTEPIEWFNSIKSNGDICMCLDPKDLTKAIIRENYKAPKLQEITYKLRGTIVFS